MKQRKLAIAVAIVGLILLVASPLFAQEDGKKGKKAKKGTSTVLLKFETMDVSQDIMDAFYVALNDGVNGHEDMHVVSGGEVTINELILTVGCDKPDPKCLSGLSDYVDAERMVFGSIQRSDDVYLFTAKLFDFAEERFMREVSEQTVEGDKATVKQAIPAMVEGFLYGDVGTLKVSAAKAGGARVFFDGEKMGPAPTTLKNLPLGQHAVTLKTSDGKEETKFVMLRKGSTANVDFQIKGAGSSGGMAKSDKGSPVLGYVATALGLAGLGVGIAGSTQYTKNMGLAEEMQDCSLDNTICSPSGVNLTPSETGERAETINQRIKTGATMSYVGYSVAGVGLGVGGYLLYRHFSSTPEGSSQQQLSEVLRVTPRANGASVGLSVDFR